MNGQVCITCQLNVEADKHVQERTTMIGKLPTEQELVKLRNHMVDEINKNELQPWCAQRSLSHDVGKLSELEFCRRKYIYLSEDRANVC